MSVIDTNPARQISPAYAERSYQLAPGERVEIDRPGNFVAAIAASGDFRLGLDGGALTAFRAGLTYEAPVAFRRVVIDNPGTAAISVTLGIGLGSLRDARLNLSGQIVTEPAAPDGFHAGTGTVAAGGTLTLAAPAGRQVVEVGIRNLGTDRLWVSDTAGAATGHPLEAGEVLVLTCAASLEINNPGTAAADLAWWQTSRAI